MRMHPDAAAEVPAPVLATMPAFTPEVLHHGEDGVLVQDAISPELHMALTRACALQTVNLPYVFVGVLFWIFLLYIFCTGEVHRCTGG